jgi:hypothetical protein
MSQESAVGRSRRLVKDLGEECCGGIGTASSSCGADLRDPAGVDAGRRTGVLPHE